MLKINLLPIRQLKKRAKAKQQLLGMVLLFVFVVAILFTAGALQAQKIKNLEAEIRALTIKKDSYTPILNKIAQLKKSREDLTRKTEIINKLKTDSSLTVRVLDQVALKVDKQRMWLESLQQQDSALNLNGTALDDQTVAQFMDNLKESPFVKDVTLTSSTLKAVSGRNLKAFELRCVVAQPDSKKPEVANKK